MSKTRALTKVRFVGEIDPQTWAWLVRSETDLRVWYDVTIDMVTGSVSCSCMDWSCRKRKRNLLDSCKHVAAILQKAKEETE